VVECRKIEDFLVPFRQGLAGTVETGAMLGWRLIRMLMPEAKFVVLRRPLTEITASLRRFGFDIEQHELARRSAMLEMISAQAGVRTIQAAELDDVEVGKWLFEELLELPYDIEWHERLIGINIQIDMAKRVEQLTKNYPFLETLKAEITARTALLGDAKWPLN